MTDIAEYRRQVDAAAAVVAAATENRPRVGIILGTGLGQLAEAIDAGTRIGYADIPGFPLATVESHTGELLVGTLEGTDVMAMRGRFHLYEGYSPREITFPVRVMATLGVSFLLISNAAGGMRPGFKRSDIMLISDHINLQGVNPLVGPNVDEWGPRFPDMSDPYDPELRRLALTEAKNAGIRLEEGVYVAVTGPNLETRAEYRFLHRIGADAVGMSTVPEVIVARHMGVRVLALSVITDECFPDTLAPVSIPEILEAAAAAEPHLTRIMSGIISHL